MSDDPGIPRLAVGDKSGTSIEDAGAKLNARMGLLSGPAPKKGAATPAPKPPANTNTDTPADAGAEDAPPVDSESPTGEAAPGEGQPSGDDQANAEPAEGSEQEQLPPIEPPVSWDAADKEAFAKLDRGAQEIIHRRETARDKEVRRLQNDVAKLRQGGDAQTQQALSQLQQHMQRLSQTADALQAQFTDEFADIKTHADLAKLAEDDPQRYLRFNAKRELLQAANQQRQAWQQSQREKAQAEAETQRAERLMVAQQRLAEHPEAKILAADGKAGDEAREALRSYLSDAGYSDDEISGLEDSRASVIAHKAMLYDKARKAVVAAKKPALPPAKVLKPGVATDQRDADAGVTAALVQRARKTGDPKDAGRALARLLS